MFDERWGTAYAEIVPWPGLKLMSFLRAGQQLDLLASRTGHVVEVEPSVQWDVGRGVNLNVSYTQQRLRRDGGTAFDARVVDSRLGWQFDPRQRLRLSVQSSNIDRDQALYAKPVNERFHDVAAQLLYSYKLNPRSALYAGYSQGGYSDDEFQELFSSNRSLFLKLSYAWQPQA